MKCALKFQVTMLLFCSVHLFAQGSPPASEQKPQPPATSPDQKPQVGEALGGIEVLSDTMGVDFGPYLARVVHDVKQNWYNLTPENARPPIMKKGQVSIEFAVLKDGRVAGMRVERCGSSGDVAMDRAAWLGITASDPFLPLPTAFPGQYLALRFHFYYYPDRSDLAATPTGSPSTGKPSPSAESQKFVVTDENHESPVPCGRSGCNFVYAVNDKDCKQNPVNQGGESRGAGTSGRTFGPIDVLSDTMGVDFSPYMQGVLKKVKTNWYNLIPESARPPILKKGKVAIELAIMKDGRVAGMRFEQGGSSGDAALDRAAWGSITASDPFAPLPSEFGGQYLALRFHFFYNPGANELTQGLAQQNQEREENHKRHPADLAALREKCSPFTNENLHGVVTSQSPLPPQECWEVLEWMRGAASYEELVNRRQLCKLPTLANDGRLCGGPNAEETTANDSSSDDTLIIQTLNDSLSKAALKENCSHKWFSDLHPRACEWGNAQTGK